MNQAKIVFRNKKAATQTSHGRKLKYKRFNKNQKAHTEVIILYLITISVFITRIKCTSLSLRFFISIQSVAKYLFKCNDIFANHHALILLLNSLLHFRVISGAIFTLYFSIKCKNALQPFSYKTDCKAFYFIFNIQSL